MLWPFVSRVNLRIPILIEIVEKNTMIGKIPDDLLDRRARKGEINNETGGINKEKLRQYIEYLELALIVAGGIVVIGLIVEDGPDLWHSLLTWTRPSRVALGDLLVTVGVFLEVLIAFVIARVARRIDAYAEADTAKALERAAQAEVRAAEANRIVEQERSERFEAEESQLELRAFMNRTFQRTGNRTLHSFAFHAAIKGGPTGHVTVLFKQIDGGEPHQFAWQIWHALNRQGTGWSADIKPMPEDPLKDSWTGMFVRCPNAPRENWLVNPTTAGGKLLKALGSGTEGFANVANWGTVFAAETDLSLSDDHFVVEIYPQPEPLTANKSNRQSEP